MGYSYAYSSDVWPAIITLALAIYLGIYSWRRRNLPAAKAFALACLLGVFWTLGVILELSAVGFDSKVFWVKFQAIWQLPVGTVVTCFLLQYAGLEKWLTLRTYILLSIVPLLSVLLIMTNDVHHLIWTGFRMDRYVVASAGRLYWFFNSYVYLLGLVNFLVLVRLAVHSRGHRLPVAIMLTGQIVGRVGYTLDKLETVMLGPGESVLFSVGVVASAYAFAFTRFHVIDPVAAARKTVLRQMREGLFVLDLQGRIVDANPMAAEIVGAPDISLRKKRFKTLIPEAADVVENGAPEDIVNTDICLGKNKPPRHYNLMLTPLSGHDGELIGRLLLLHDVSDQKRAQARLLEQQGIVATLQERERLARELHDGIAQTLGFVRIQTQTALKWMQAGHNEKAASLMRRLVEVTKASHTDVRESIFSLKNSAGPGWSFIPVLKNDIDRFQANFGLRTELSISDGIEDNTFNDGTGVQVLRVIQEALTNARKHSGAHTLRVCVQADGNRAQITIIDDGHGFDAGELKYRHDGHFGLVFMRERMEKIGGSLKIDSVPDGGTAVKLEVPLAKSPEDMR